YLFKSSRFIYLFWAYSYGLTSDRLRLYFNDFKSIPVNIPPLPEQIKTGNVLSTWDKAIEKLEALIAAKQKRKKALMQQLLTGKMRFAGFDGTWKETALSHIANVTMGSSPKSAAYNENSVGLPLIQGNADIKNRFSAPRIHTTEITKECKPEDILMSVRAPVGAIAKSTHHACIGRGICSITARNGVDQQFLYHWFLAFEPKWASLSQGSTFESVNSADIKSLTIYMPIEEMEQQKIAAVLSAADNEITIHQTQLAALKQQKTGLMQQLLTGKKRVKVNQVAA
ncbi:MAG: restriction endonuclease subunit S, partial [Methylobacter sp.]|nr:restriction endonuclease subunit S [Methylobacter sp.]